MLKLNFGLRVMLAFPIGMAAFCLGWTQHASIKRTKHDHNAALAAQKQVEIKEVLSTQRAAEATRVKKLRDEIERRERLDRYKQIMRDPIDAKMSPRRPF